MSITIVTYNILAVGLDGPESFSKTNPKYLKGSTRLRKNFEKTGNFYQPTSLYLSSGSESGMGRDT